MNKEREFEEFSLPRMVKKEKLPVSANPVIRIDAQAYNVLVDLSNESYLPISKIASMAIMYAYKHLSYEDEL